jgi:hypothetical protein
MRSSTWAVQILAHSSPKRFPLCRQSRPIGSDLVHSGKHLLNLAALSDELADLTRRIAHRQGQAPFFAVRVCYRELSLAYWTRGEDGHSTIFLFGSRRHLTPRLVVDVLKEPDQEHGRVSREDLNGSSPSASTGNIEMERG